MADRIMFRAIGIVCLSFSIGGCAQLGFMSEGFFDRGPTVLASCNEKAPIDSTGTAEKFVRPERCDTLDEAKARLGEGNYSAAEEKFKEGVEAFTIDTTRRADLRTAWFGLAAVYDNQRRFDAADKAYAMIKTSFGEDVRYYNNYGYSLYLRGRYADAEAQFRAALAIKPDDERILSNLELVRSAKPSASEAPVSDQASPNFGLPSDIRSPTGEAAVEVPSAAQ
jgi:tetratricopeptide (TPR) repeat protein